MQKTLILLWMACLCLSSFAQSLDHPLRQKAYDYYYGSQTDSAELFFIQSLQSQSWDETSKLIHEAEIQVMRSLNAIHQLQVQAGFAHIDSAFAFLEDIEVNIDTLRQKMWLAKGIIHFKSQQFPQSLASWEQSEALLKRFPSHIDTLSSYINLVNLKAGAYFRLGQNAKAKASYEAILPYYQEIEAPLQISNTLSNLGNISFATEDYSGAAKAYMEAIAMAEAHDPPLLTSVASSSMNLSYVLRGFGDYEGALRYARKTEAAFEAIGSPSVDKVKMLLGLIYADRGDFQQAIELHKYYYRRILNTRGAHSLEAKNILGNLALLYYNVKDYQEAEKNARQVIEIIQQFEQLPPQYQLADYIIMGSILVRLDRETEAQPYFAQAEALLQNVRANKDFHLSSYYEAMAKLYLSAQDYERSIDFALKAEDLWKEKELASLSARTSNLSTLASAYFAQGKLQDAEKIIQHKWDLIELSSFDPGKDVQLPALQSVPNLDKFVKTIIISGDIASQRTEHVRAYNTFRLAADLMDSIRINRRERGWSLDSDYEVLYERDEIFDKGMATLYTLYEQTGDPQWIEEALTFSERNKATLLAEAFAQQEARQVFNIPLEILDQEKLLRSRILQLEQQLLLTKERPGSPLEDQVPIWEEEIYQTRTSHDSLIQILRKRYPDYYRLTYQTPKIDIQSLQRAIRPDEALVEYFVADSTIYTMVLYGEKRHFLRSTLPTDWGQSISKYHQAIYRSFLPQTVSQSPTHPLSDLAYEQYNRFWKALAELGLPKKILLVPDAELGYLSFETLISSKPSVPEAYTTWDFLIRQHHFRYTYAGSLLPSFQTLPKHQAPKGFIAFAPTYTQLPDLIASTRGDLGNLPFAQREAERLHQLMGGKLLTNTSASEEAFKTEAGDYRLVHIAGHAIIDDAQGLSSHIIFTEDTTSQEDQRLEIRELFNIDLKADLVVLSACETGIGEMRKGEGIISLAWGMIYAGAQSVVTTLWQVNDQATEKLMAQFYQYLTQGMSKDQALHQAKIDYLSQGDNISAHPYLWGSFIIVGDHQPISSPIFPWWWVIGGLLGVGIVGGGLILRRQNAQNVRLPHA
ncbi:MAG: CHAT domain-containing protein [Bacteroidota bacterium]